MNDTVPIVALLMTFMIIGMIAERRITMNEVKKTMFPRAFLIWLIDEQEIFLGELSERYITKDDIRMNGKLSLTLDELYQYWRLEIEPKNKEDEGN